MPASRFTNLALLTATVCSLCVRGVVAQDETVWQPYRELQPLKAQSAVTPAQHVVADPAAICPPCAISATPLNPAPPNYLPEQTFATAQPAPTYLSTQFGVPTAGPQLWKWHLLPDDVIWHSYWAGAKESRMSGAAFQETNSNQSLFDVTLGGRTSVLRYGTTKNNRPEGWELQLEGSSMVRLNLDENWDVEAVDFRFGVPIIYGHDKFQYKFSYYHLSSHVGDEFLVRNPGFTRLNFSRDVLVAGVSFFPMPAWRWYAEAGWAFYADEGTEPWEFQFGLDYAQPGPTGSRGTPFVALNGHLRQELDFGGNLVAQAGWLWRGQTDHVLRTGLHYHNGKSSQFEFFNEFEQQIGVGLWYDY